MCLRGRISVPNVCHTILDDPDISKPSSSGSSLTEMIVSLPTPPYRTGVRQNVLLHCMPQSTSIRGGEEH